MTGDFKPADIRALREKMGLTQPQLAPMLGIGQAYLSNLETGRDGKKPSSTLVILLGMIEQYGAPQNPRSGG